MTGLPIEHGSFHPLGSSWDGQGVNFALFSEHATAVELCLFDEQGREERIPVPWRSLYVWHLYVRGLGPGQRYGWRVHGPFSPAKGHRFNPNKLLLDPYARALDGALDWRAPVYGYPQDRGLDDLAWDARDDAAGKPKAVVVDDAFDWEGDRPPHVPWHNTVLYELHVRGFTKLHPEVPDPQRGTYLGVATIRARAASSGRRSSSAASTTASTTASIRSTRASTSTSPAAATRSTRPTRRCSSSSPTACATG
jgi:glycogen operon protein